MNNNELKKELLKTLENSFKSQRFILKGSSLVSENEKGFYQVISISLGLSTSIMKNHFGISFGIATEEWINFLNNYKRPKNISTSDCEIRDCDNILFVKREGWFPIYEEKNKMFREIENYINETIFNFFEFLKSRDNLIAEWRKFNFKIGFAEGRHKLAIGIILLHINNVEEGQLLLQKLYNQKKENDYFTKVIENIFNVFKIKLKIEKKNLLQKIINRLK